MYTISVTTIDITVEPPKKSMHFITLIALPVVWISLLILLSIFSIVVLRMVDFIFLILAIIILHFILIGITTLITRRKLLFWLLLKKIENEYKTAVTDAVIPKIIFVTGLTHSFIDNDPAPNCTVITVSY